MAVGDIDGDGRAAIVEFVEGTDPMNQDQSTISVELKQDGELTLEFLQMIGNDEVHFSVQRSLEFNEWQGEGTEYRGRVNNGDGTETVRFRVDSMEFFTRNGFLRLSVSQEP